MEPTVFDSVILAGGFGKRMLPLTCDIPKPMLPVAGETAYSRVMKLLRGNGFVSTAVTTMYLPEMIEHAACNRELGGTTEFFREDSGSPLGSAGAVKALADRLSERFCVISGDAVCSFPLASLFEDFEKSGADAAMLLYRVKDAGEYGTVCVSGGEVTGFCEKPSVRDTLSDLVNTGIYFLKKDAFAESCGGRTECDFGKNVFPTLLRSGKRIKGYVPEGFWFDIGSFYEYHRCNMFISHGENLIGRHVSVHPEAKIVNCLVFDGAVIGKSVVCGSIVGRDAVIGNGCFIPPGCVIGPECELRDGAALEPGRITDRGETVSPGANGYFKKAGQALELGDESIRADKDDRAFFVNFGSYAVKNRAKAAVIAQSEEEEGFAAELACGAAGSGCDIYVCSRLGPAEAAFAAKSFGLERVFHIAAVGENLEIRIYGKDGMPIAREEIRDLTLSGKAERFPGGKISALARGEIIKRYAAELRESTGAGRQTQIRLRGGKNESFAAEVAAELKAGEGGDCVFSIGADGASASALLDSGREISYWHLLAECLILSGKRTVALPNDTPTYAESLLRSHAIEPVFYGDGQSAERAAAADEPITRDGTRLIFTLAELLRKNGLTLESATDSLAPFTVLTRSVYADKEKVPALIAELRGEYGGRRCVGFDIGDGHVSVFPSAAGAFKIVAEAVDSETAEEISLRAMEMIEKRDGNDRKAR